MHYTRVSIAVWDQCRMALDVRPESRARRIRGTRRRENVEWQGAGITVECCPIRHMLNLESVITYEGTETIHELVVGRELCGTAAF